MTDYRETEFCRGPDVEIHYESLRTAEAVLISGGGRHFRLQGLPKRILMIFDGERHDVRWIAAKLSLDSTEESLQQVYDAIRRLQGYGLVRNVADIQNAAAGEVAPPRPRRSKSIDFVWKCPVLPARAVQALARPFVPLLRPAFMRFGIPIMAAAQIWFLWTHRAFLHPAYYASKFSAAAFAALVVANYLALFLHEFGHASACQAAGRKSGAIGVCLYIMFPGLYTDVTESWKLPSGKRLIVDAGGIYFSLIGATLSSVAYLALHNPVVGVLACLCDLTVIINLNPIVRMDGYWILGDLLDMPHLMDLNKAVTAALLSRCLFLRQLAFPAVPKTSRWSVQIYYFYYCLFIGMVLYFSFLTLVHGVPYVYNHYPPILRGAVEQLTVSPLSWKTARKLLSLLLATVSIVGIVLVFFRLNRLFFAQVAMIWSADASPDLPVPDGLEQGGERKGSSAHG